MITPKVVISLLMVSRGIIPFEEHKAAVGTTSNNKFSKRKALDEGSLLSQHALLRASEARLIGALSKGGKMRGVATNVYLWKTSEKPKETGHNENSKFGSCIYV